MQQTEHNTFYPLVLLDTIGEAVFVIDTQWCYTYVNKKAEELLCRPREELLRTLADSAPSMIWVADPDGTITFRNKQWIEYTGISPTENMNNWAELVLHPDDLDRCMQAWQQALKEGSDYEIEVRNKRHDGVYRWFITRVLPVRDTSGRITAWYGSSTDNHEASSWKQS